MKLNYLKQLINSMKKTHPKQDERRPARIALTAILIAFATIANAQYNKPYVTTELCDCKPDSIVVFKSKSYGNYKHVAIIKDGQKYYIPGDSVQTTMFWDIHYRYVWTVYVDKNFNRKFDKSKVKTNGGDIIYRPDLNQYRYKGELINPIELIKTPIIR